jgi:hypothetical protein
MRTQNWTTAIASLALLGGAAALRLIERQLSQIGSASEELLRGQRLPVLKTTHKTHEAAQDSATLGE